ncbi:MAG: bifunctional metallophosphatase/5'-nucleotidase [Faecalicoccus sp.]|nr:bifunctional metallophosphatase/5'-nucleotidase [Faecalicoccus sp.]
MNRFKKMISIFTVFMLILTTGCANNQKQEQTVEKNGNIVIFFTSDIHCALDKGFGFEGLQQIRDSYEARGYTTLLVDDGDAIQGENVGVFTQGEAIINLMNTVKYDVAIPGNHEFDYGMDRFMELTKIANFPYISCNIHKEGELLFEPYIIKEAAGKKIAFIGITTPMTITSSTPKFFQNEKGEYIYDFSQDDTGEKLYAAVQSAIDGAKAEGADYIYVMGHCGLEEECAPWTYADIISHTSGINVFLDGHSHDTEQIVMKDKDGNDVVRSAVGTKWIGIGYSIITPEEGIKETNIISWTNKISAPEMFNFNNAATPVVKETKAKLEETMGVVVGHSDVDLIIHDPVAVDSIGKPVRIVRTQETNLGDLEADAIRTQCDADIALVGGGGIRTPIKKGDITYGDILNVAPFGNQLTVVEATGQQILDALEWGARALPAEFGGFLQVSGMSYDIDVSIPSPCKSDQNSMMTSIEGERRVRNVKINGEPIDPAKTYTVAGLDYLLLNKGDGNTAFDGATLVKDGIKLDAQAIIEYITEDLNGTVGEEYSNPYGQGRITILNGE